MEEYMCKTRGDYGSGVTRPKINAKYHFELKGQFLKDLRDDTFSGSDHEDANEHIEKVLEIVDLFHIPNITQDQIMLRAFSMSLTRAVSRWLRNKPSGSITTWEGLKTKFLNNMGKIQRTIDEMPSILFNIYAGAIQEMAEYSKKWHNRTYRTRSTKTSDGLAAIQAQLNNLGREIKNVNEKVYAAQVGCELCKGPHYTKVYPLIEEGKPFEEVYYTQFGVPFQQGGKYRAAASGFYQRNNANSSYQERRQSMEESLSKNQGALIKALEIQIGQMNKVLLERDPPDTPYRPNRTDEDKGSYGLKDLDAYSIGTTLRDDSLPRKEKHLESFTLPCYINNVCFEKALADLGASVSVMPLSTYLTLGLGELAHTKLSVELANKTVKHPKGIDENILVWIGKFVFPVDFIILDMSEDVNVPLILGRPFLSTAHAKIDVLRERMDLDLEARLMGETLILNRSFDPLYGDYIELNHLNEALELRRNRVDDLEPTIEEGEAVNEPIMNIVKTRCNFIGGTDDYPVVEDMDPYLDEGMGDVIVGEPFCKASCVEARRFDGIITIRDGNDSVTYQMVRSNPRFKHPTNEKCNKIPPLLKVSEHNKMNGISHSYQKLKGFYKGVLNLGLEFIQDAKVEEWLTCGHISVHEKE
ncbi:DNA-directed DNA polymerase [Tanacetum coccineum]